MSHTCEWQIPTLISGFFWNQAWQWGIFNGCQVVHKARKTELVFALNFPWVFFLIIHGLKLSLVWKWGKINEDILRAWVNNLIFSSNSIQVIMAGWDLSKPLTSKTDSFSPQPRNMETLLASTHAITKWSDLKIGYRKVSFRARNSWQTH